MALPVVDGQEKQRYAGVRRAARRMEDRGAHVDASDADVQCLLAIFHYLFQGAVAGQQDGSSGGVVVCMIRNTC
jgi:hypothetical protein